jgi:glycosyltransferase involved in cell wall biosynthesis
MIYLDCRLVERKPSGISRFSIEIANRFIDKYGVDDVTCIVNESNEELKGKQLLISYKPFNFLHFIYFYFFLRKLKPSVYVSFHYSGLLFSIPNCFSIITVHDLMYRFVDNFFGSRFRDFVGKRYYDFIVKRSLTSSNQVISVSDVTRRDILENFNFDSLVCLEGVNLLKTGLNEQLDVDINIPFDSFYLYVGNARPHKGVKEFINAFSKYHESNPERGLVLVGNHEQHDTEGVFSAGFVDDFKLKSLYKKSIALIFPSKYEGFGLPVLEAISSSKPVIANRIPAFEEFESSNIHFFELNNVNSIFECLDKDLEFDSKDKSRLMQKYTWNSSFESFLCVMPEIETIYE